ncbi:hypothetical protein FOCG_17605 [Fusarium oxysporum f. sp. radicis-lycopersici 26381]|uniref:MADS-box domain-containing protein n=8 Tax=Fusarium TaxID=5506 RepID=A0A9P9JS57_FUSRE|nr:uncharacterized protein BKA55DRAFT_583452 [Fusarium redolens]EWZ29305.1 hypothetical protein FOZG_17167 [Fusarium oxysporum Fo47]EWZ77450.1 hypothetical protein FOWG_18144 [Fusarium oxysporum f. sp. lycopersici MN25]EXA28742.1 hypothetical protein FOVG_19667 [Fusarium oxysporum f. sp. pisi HDV247]EXK27436.1 hypothetical protein FOMG_15989 [Fusarium oxysporum f. sp. melonis 26406]EXL39803.1 hypothetical protein FOCG_17605 [Fusarium oxysporum f. sp. radicis-lycopersici 26381]EXL65017.1 hypot
MSHPKVTRRKRRTETLKNKMKQYSHIFNVNITVIMQDRSTLQNQTFTFSPDHGWATTPSHSTNSPDRPEIVTWPEGQNFVERLKQRFEQLNVECPP